MSQDVSEFIEHYGKKGMQWGKRSGGGAKVSGSRLNATLKTTTTAGFKGGKQRKLSSDYKATVPLRNRNTKELSNKQLQKTTSRINAEQNYKRLNPSKITKGANAAKGVLALASTAAAVYTLANSPAGKAGIAFVRKNLLRK